MRKAFILIIKDTLSEMCLKNLVGEIKELMYAYFWIVVIIESASNISCHLKIFIKELLLSVKKKLETLVRITVEQAFSILLECNWESYS